jgi:NTP pyrophosphatase (non-canonical NTP hydrolase)
MLNNNGLGKLIEECGELQQVAGKKLAMMDSDSHWDGSNLKERLEDEIADVRAACFTVAVNFGLDEERIANRMQYKKSLFDYWHRGGTETSIPWPTNGKFGVVDIEVEPSAKTDEREI